MTKKIEEPLEELAAMKGEDWPFYAVFQKGLMRHSAIAWRHFSVVGGTRNSTVEDFLTNWISFLDDLTDRGLLKVKASPPKKDKDRIWAGISLNVGETVRWSESAVQRIAALLILWWYFYATAKHKIEEASSRRSQQHEAMRPSPKAKELLRRRMTKGLRSVIARPDEELEDEEINKRVDKRLRDLILLALNKGVTDDGDEEEEEGEEDTSTTVAEVVNSAPRTRATRLSRKRIRGFWTERTGSFGQYSSRRSTAVPPGPSRQVMTHSRMPRPVWYSLTIRSRPLRLFLLGRCRLEEPNYSDLFGTSRDG